MSELYRYGCTDGGRRRDIVKCLAEGRSSPMIRKGLDFSVVENQDRLQNRLSIIIPAQNEEVTIGRVIRESQQLAPYEIIVVVNGSFDRTESIARQYGASVIVYEEALGTDVGRAIGALAATGDLLLFIDGDFIIPWKELCPFTDAAASRCDIAVNKLDHHLGLHAAMGTVTTLKCAINIALGRGELANASLVNVPFAMNRHALDVIHWSSLLCPPKAYALGMLGGLLIKPVHTVEVDRLNRYRPHKHNRDHQSNSLAAMQIIGDHYEALHAIHQFYDQIWTEGEKRCSESTVK